MSVETEIVERERQFWTGSVDFYERWMAREVVMICPAPVGMLQREKVLEGIQSGGRWTSVEMSDVSVRPKGDSVILLAYRVCARKAEAGSDYHALVGSAYVREDSEWKLAAHQHTPVPKWGS